MDPYRLAAPLLRALDPETAHRLTLRALRTGLVPRRRERDDPILSLRVLGLDFPNPVGLAAGFDKNAEAPDALLGQGFGFVEVGTVTPKPQAGNPRPRVFRLAEDEAVINRLGFNNDGLERVAARLRARHGRGGIVGANIGCNADTADAVGDYVAGFQALRESVDYLVVNVSSPNTPGLRALQERESLDRLLAALQGARAGVVHGAWRAPPLLVKIAPDLDAKGREAIAEVALERAIDGLIVGNTTLGERAGLRGRHRGEQGGLSGPPLFARSTRLLGEMYRLTGGALTCIGVGGVRSGADAYAKVRAGASLVQLYTALAYEGPGLVARIKAELAEALKADGYTSVAEAVGADADKKGSGTF